jgi:hypothetical protein
LCQFRRVDCADYFGDRRRFQREFDSLSAAIRLDASWFTVPVAGVMMCQFIGEYDRGSKFMVSSMRALKKVQAIGLAGLGLLGIVGPSIAQVPPLYRQGTKIQMDITGLEEAQPVFNGNLLRTEISNECGIAIFKPENRTQLLKRYQIGTGPIVDISDMNFPPVAPACGDSNIPGSFVVNATGTLSTSMGFKIATPNSPVTVRLFYQDWPIVKFDSCSVGWLKVPNYLLTPLSRTVELRINENEIGAYSGIPEKPKPFCKQKTGTNPVLMVPLQR